MGYESRVYVVHKTRSAGWDSSNTSQLFYAQVEAVFNLSKCGFLADLFNKETNCFIYADDGNTVLLKDRYDDSLKEADKKQVIEFIQNNYDLEDYKNLKHFLEYLKSIQDDDFYTILHYGY